MVTTSSSDQTKLFSTFNNLYSQLNSNKYPITSSVLKGSDTRLREYLKKISLNQIDEKLLFEIIQLNKLLPLLNSPKVKISDLSLSKWISGRPYRFDEKHDDNARNLFFEADCALRFVKSEIDFKTIDLHYEQIEDECDIVIDEKIIVECKDISAEKRIYERIQKANEQLTIRLQHFKTDAAGIIAIDISQIIQTDIQAFFENELLPTLNKNNLIYKLIDNSSDPEVRQVVYENCIRYFNEQLEKLNITVDQLKNLQISPDIYSIMVQSDMITIIDRNNGENSVESIPIYGRVMTPLENPLYKGKIKFSSNFHKSLQHQF